MGGLWKYMFIMVICFLIGILVICGIFFFVGFWFKDEIFGFVFQVNFLFWFVGWVIVGMIVFYMFWMYFMIFEGGFWGNDQEVKDGVLQFYGLLFNFGLGVMNVKELDYEVGYDDYGYSSEFYEFFLIMMFFFMVLVVFLVLIGLLGWFWVNQFEVFIYVLGEVVEYVVEFEWGEFYVMVGNFIGIVLIGIIVVFLMYW